MFAGQAQTFYDDLSAAAKQLTKMETYLASNKEVGLLPETLRSQQRQFMVSCVSAFAMFVMLLVHVFVIVQSGCQTHNGWAQPLAVCLSSLLA